MPSVLQNQNDQSYGETRLLTVRHLFLTHTSFSLIDLASQPCLVGTSHQIIEVVVGQIGFPIY
jgi:hypothetical protein